MEIILAIVVAAAVIFFGALISAGNERQRKAIDSLRDQAVLWAMQDLRIKRERLARDIRVDDPLGWLNRIVANVSGSDMNLQVVEASDKPYTLICEAASVGAKVILTPLSPNEIRAMKHARHSRLSQFGERNTLLSLPRGARVYECSVLNSGILFDLELPLAWKGLTGQGIEQMQRLWIYDLS